MVKPFNGNKTIDMSQDELSIAIERIQQERVDDSVMGAQVLSFNYEDRILYLAGQMTRGQVPQTARECRAIARAARSLLAYVEDGELSPLTDPMPDRPAMPSSKTKTDPVVVPSRPWWRFWT